MKNKPLMTSLRQDWKTPKALFQGLDAEFHFDCDPCPPKHKEDGLQMKWGDINFINPPFDNISSWVGEAFARWTAFNKTIVMLIPARTDTRWWHDYVLQADEIRFIKGRLCFDDGKGRATFPSVIVIFKSKKENINA